MNELFGKIGDKEIVFRETFVIPNGETLEFSFSTNYPGTPPAVTYDKFTLNVRLKCGTKDDLVKAEWGDAVGKPFVEISVPDMKGRLGPAITGPIKIGDVLGKNLGFSVAFSSPGENTLATLQFVLGGTYE